MNANIITQLSIFVNNAPGSLANVAKTLRECEINMKACNLAESTEFGILRAIVDDPAGAIEKLQKKNIIVKKIDPEAVDPEDVEMLEDMVLVAVNEALRGVAEAGERRLASVTGGMSIPGLF